MDGYVEWRFGRAVFVFFTSWSVYTHPVAEDVRLEID
jgi:hypothetical protein